MKSKILKSLITPILGLSAIATIAITSTSCNASKSPSKDIPIEEIEFDPENEFNLAIGSTYPLKLKITPIDATIKGLSWKSSDDSIATVDQNGNVTGINEGPVNITVSLQKNPNISAAFTMIVFKSIPVEGVKLEDDEEKIELEVDDSAILHATVLPEDATNKDVFWESSDPDIVLVFDNGKIKAVKSGTATITVTTLDGNHKATCEVTVHKSVKDIKLNVSDLEVPIGYSRTLKVTILPEDASNKEVAWSSSVEEVATIDDNGKIDGLTLGKTIIIVKSLDDPSIKASCEVEVKEKSVEGVQLNKNTLDLGIEQTQKLEATVLPEEATNKNVIWKSRDVEIATVDQEGNVKGVSNGETIITVTTVDGECKATCAINVYMPIKRVAAGRQDGDQIIELETMNHNPSIYKVGNFIKLIPIIEPENVQYESITWKSLDDRTYFDQGGIITFKSIGIARVQLEIKTKYGSYSLEEDLQFMIDN